jgi:hypothetical protein
MRNSTTTRAFVTVLASTAFFWTLTLSASPQLHERVHPDAGRVEHSCAVTFIASGNFDHSPVALIISRPAPIDEFKLPALKPRWVESLFLIAAVFEHAPPANS